MKKIFVLVSLGIIMSLLSAAQGKDSLVPFNKFSADTSMVMTAKADTFFYQTNIPGYVGYPDSLMTYSENGIASWYGKEWNGRPTSSGEIYSTDSMTAAHKKLPLGSVVKVTNYKNDSVIFVKITDRLPQNSKRSIDLTPTAAKKLNFYTDGLTNVKIEVIGYAPIYKRTKKSRPAPRAVVAKK